MISVQNITVSWQTAMELRKLGAPQSALYYWVTPVNGAVNSYPARIMPFLEAQRIVQDNDGDDYDLELSAAFTLQELGERIGKPFYSGRDECGAYAALATQDGFLTTIQRADTELEARAQLLESVLKGARQPAQDPAAFASEHLFVLRASRRA
jgi:hypothetical protein